MLALGNNKKKVTWPTSTKTWQGVLAFQAYSEVATSGKSFKKEDQYARAFALYKAAIKDFLGKKGFWKDVAEYPMKAYTEEQMMIKSNGEKKGPQAIKAIDVWNKGFNAKASLTLFAATYGHLMKLKKEKIIDDGEDRAAAAASRQVSVELDSGTQAEDMLAALRTCTPRPSVSSQSFRSTSSLL